MADSYVAYWGRIPVLSSWAQYRHARPMSYSCVVAVLLSKNLGLISAQAPAPSDACAAVSWPGTLHRPTKNDSQKHSYRKYHRYACQHTKNNQARIHFQITFMHLRRKPRHCPRDFCDSVLCSL